jgi:outer membrane receptor protein involved in Fe transport
LWDLYQRQVVTSSGISDPLTHVAGSANTVAGGNPALTPEIFRNATAGLVYTPDWPANFSATIDYFHIASDNAIAAVSGLDPAIQAICLASPAGSSPYCALVTRPGPYNDTSPANFPTLIYNVNQNIAKTYAEGIDVEIDYQTDLADWSGISGIVNMRALWTHQPILKMQALPGAVVTNAAGAAAAPTAATPVDKAALTLDYRLGRAAVTLLERFDSAIHQSANPTLVFDIPDLRPYWQTDFNFGYEFAIAGQPVNGFLNINNLFNVQGGIFQVPGYTGSPGMNYPVVPYADLLGRYFTLGLRLHN